MGIPLDRSLYGVKIVYFNNKYKRQSLPLNHKITSHKVNSVAKSAKDYSVNKEKAF